MGFKVIKTSTPNYRKGRNGKNILAIVDHITAGSFPGCLDWMRNPAAKASSHYLVTRGGEVYQLVEDKNTAWHAGGINRPTWKLCDGSNPNETTIGIEHENTGGGALTEAQYQATLSLHWDLIQKYHIPIDRDHILGHCEIDSVSRKWDPGAQFPWKRLLRDLRKKEERGERMCYNTINELPEWGKNTVQKLLDKKYLSGDGNALDLSQDMVRILVIMDRAGVFDRVD